jgi:hypothetical protein
MSVAVRERIRPKSRKDSKLVASLVSAVATGITTIAVAFIGIVPQLRTHDKADIANLQEKVTGLMKPQEGAWALAGNIQLPARKSNGNHQDESAEVYLVPLTLGSQTDSAGDYNIRNVPLGDYILFARFPNGKTVTMQIDQPTKTLHTDDGFEISYAKEDGQH